MSSDDLWNILDLLLTGWVLALILIMLANTNKKYYSEFSQYNLGFRKLCGSLIVIKAYRLIKLIF